MQNRNLPDSELLKAVLQPLLEDFQYWLGRSRQLLESQNLDFLEIDQADLLSRVKQAQQEVGAAQALMQVTNGQAGIEATILVSWHSLVTECWQVSHRFRKDYPSEAD